MPNYVDVRGCLTFWVSSDGVSRSRLRAALDREGVRHCVPRVRAPLSALKRAVHDALDAGAWPRQAASDRLLVRPLRRQPGYAVVREYRLAGGELGYRHLGSTLHDDRSPGSVRFVEAADEPPDAFVRGVRDGYRLYSDLMPSSALSDFLASLLNVRFGATSLRPSGGLYQFREALHDDWVQWVGVVTDCVAPGRRGPDVYTLLHQMDEDAARAVLDGLRREIRARAAELREEVTGDRLGARGKAARRAEAKRLLAKVETAEATLDEALPDLKAQLREVATLTAGLTILAAAEATTA